jgi:polysaccharide export outer membrane protein
LSDQGYALDPATCASPSLLLNHQMPKIDDGGAISFPLVGLVRVRGLTTQWLPRALSQRRGRPYPRASVAVEIEQYRPFFIRGGQDRWPVRPCLRMTAGLRSHPGGFSDTADRTRAIIHRRQGKEMIRAPSISIFNLLATRSPS